MGSEEGMNVEVTCAAFLERQLVTTLFGALCSAVAEVKFAVCVLKYAWLFQIGTSSYIHFTRNTLYFFICQTHTILPILTLKGKVKISV